MDAEIRRATLADSDQMFSLVEDFATSFRPERKAFERSVEQLLRDDSALIIVAVCEGAVIGYCLAFDHYAFCANGRVTWVEEIMVREDLRGKGVGRQLMEAVEEWAVSSESKLVGLATRRAAPFYRALGYEESALFFRKMINWE